MKSLTYYWARAAGRTAVRERTKYLKEKETRERILNESIARVNEKKEIKNKEIKNNKGQNFNDYCNALFYISKNIFYTYDNFKEDPIYHLRMGEYDFPREDIEFYDEISIYLKVLIEMMILSDECNIIDSAFSEDGFAFSTKFKSIKNTILYIDEDMKYVLTLNLKTLKDYETESTEYSIQSIKDNLLLLIKETLLAYSNLIISNDTGIINELAINVMYDDKCYGTYHYKNQKENLLFQKQLLEENFDKYFKISTSISKPISAISIKEKNENEILNNNEKVNILKKEIINSNMIIIKSISNMLYELKQKKEFLNSDTLVCADINEILTNFFIDSYKINDYNKLCELFSYNYFEKKINTYCKGKYKKNTIDYIEALLDVEAQKIQKSLNLEIEEEANYDIILNSTMLPKFFDINEECLFCADTFLTSMCIIKLLFANKTLNQLNKKSEFYIILQNMKAEFGDYETNLLTEKLYPIYLQYYTKELNNIEDALYFSLIVILEGTQEIKSSFKKIILECREEGLYTYSGAEFSNIDKDIKKLIDNFVQSGEYSDKDLNISYIVMAILEELEKHISYSNLMLCLVNDKAWNDYYCRSKDLYEKEQNRLRYLNKDFSTERKEINNKFEFNNIESGTQFETYLKKLFEELGYKTKHNGKSGDQGADLILEKNNYTYLIQAKFYSGKLGNTPVQEVVGALKYYNANQGIVITNSVFTQGAENLAKANNVILIDGEDLKKLVKYIFKKTDNDILQDFVKVKYIYNYYFK